MQRGLMKKALILSVVVFIIVSIVGPTAFLTIPADLNLLEEKEGEGNDQVRVSESKEFHEVKGKIREGETLFDIFKKYGLHPGDLFSLREASADIHKLRNLRVDQPYRILFDADKQINSFTYWIDDDTILNITCGENGFCAGKIPVSYEKRTEQLAGVIKDNLISSLSQDKESLMLALDLSDIFAWDIDFATDIRKGDTFKVVVEGLYLNGEFRKYGRILSAEIVNKGEPYHAYRFEDEEGADYYDATGRSLKKAFLKAPLSFRRISSNFSRGRYHPILKITRPHHGIDYAALQGTPVSSAGDGTVVFAGKRGQYGNLVILRHRNGYTTYYGHLSKINSNVRKGVRIAQGSLIGNVGATGLATGPHLHYEMRINDRPVNPLSIKIPRGRTITGKSMAEFARVKAAMDIELASVSSSTFLASQKGTHGKTLNKEG